MAKLDGTEPIDPASRESAYAESRWPMAAAVVAAMVLTLLLPDDFRLVFVLREIEGLSVESTAEALGVLPATVKTRLLRARRRLQAALAPEVKTALTGSFPFAGADCAALTERVVEAWRRGTGGYAFNDDAPRRPDG